MFSRIINTKAVQDFDKSLYPAKLIQLLMSELHGYKQFHNKYYDEIADILTVLFVFMWTIFFLEVISKRWSGAQKSLRFALFFTFLLWSFISGIVLFFTYFHVVMLLGMILLI